MNFNTEQKKDAKPQAQHGKADVQEMHVTCSGIL